MFHRFLIWLAYRMGLDPRGLFVYFDGRRYRYGDPMVMARDIWSVPGFEPDKLKEQAISGDGMSKLQAFEEIAHVVRIAWNIKSAEEGGLTDLECFQLHNRFESYLGDLKKNGSPGQTSPQFTVPDVSGFEVTSPALGSGSISTAST